MTPLSYLEGVFGDSRQPVVHGASGPRVDDYLSDLVCFTQLRRPIRLNDAHQSWRHTHTHLENTHTLLSSVYQQLRSVFLPLTTVKFALTQRLKRGRAAHSTSNTLRCRVCSLTLMWRKRQKKKDNLSGHVCLYVTGLLIRSLY